MRTITLLTLTILLSLSIATSALGHTALCACFDNGDGTITCEGAFSDGSSAAGVTMRLLDKNNKLILESRLNADSEFTFDKPETSFKVQFDAGPGHEVEILSSEIGE